MHIDPRGVRLLLVDADDARRGTLAGSLRALGYGTVLESGDGPAAIAACAGRAPDLVLADLDRDGDADLLALLQNDLAPGARLPTVALISDGSVATRERIAQLGVQDVAVRPLADTELRLRIDNALAGVRLRRLLNDRSARLTEALRDRSAETDTVRESLAALAAMADYHDDDLDHHAQRVGAIAAAVASALNLPQTTVEMLRMAAPLHDIGKVGISRRILLKPGKLTPPEWLHMQSHVDIGAQILHAASAPVLVLAAEIAQTHHERYDGSGYTAGLRGEEIPLSGRIVAVADVWDTLTHDRPYRPAWTVERALAEIHAGVGTHFDPRVVEAFASLDLAAAEPAPVTAPEPQIA
jgi:putative two-component system response regulator